MHEDYDIYHDISIHSLRMEGDAPCLPFCLPQIDFNPLPPYGGRLHKDRRLFIFCGISIHSLRMEGDENGAASGAFSIDISIHSLRMEGDCEQRCESPHDRKFQSTPSVWRETFG